MTVRPQREREQREVQLCLPLTLGPTAIFSAEPLREAVTDRRVASDEVGMRWWNSLTDRERAYWLDAAGSARAVDAWRAYRSRLYVPVTRKVSLKNETRASGSKSR